MTDELSPEDLLALRRAYERVSARGWGLALGMLSAVGLFVATIVLVIKGGPDPGPHLELLGNYFPGFTVTWFGACIGAAYAFVVGYAAGHIVGLVYNKVVDASS